VLNLEVLLRVASHRPHLAWAKFLNVLWISFVSIRLQQVYMRQINENNEQFVLVRSPMLW